MKITVQPSRGFDLDSVSGNILLTTVSKRMHPYLTKNVFDRKSNSFYIVADIKALYQQDTKYC